MKYQQIEVNGEIVEFPEDMSDEQIASVLRGPEPEPAPVPEPVPMEERFLNNSAPNVLDTVLNNLDIPAGMGGAVVGARAGAPLGPPGAVAGGVVGGALGTFAGAIGSDALTQEDIDYANAVEQAVYSAGIDLGLLGLGKAAAPFIKAMRRSGKSVEDAAEFFKGVAQGTQAGSQQSLKASQAILQPGGATLTPIQTGRAALHHDIGEKLARTGMFSQRVMATNAEKVNDVVNQALQDLIAGGGRAPTELGGDIYSVIDVGQHAMEYTYGEGLKTIGNMLKGTQVSLVPTRNFFTRVIREYSRNDGMFSTLNDKVLGLVHQYRDKVSEYPNISGRDLIDLEKVFGEEARDLATNDKGVLNKVVDRQVTQLMEEFRKSITKSLKKANPQAAIEYRALNKAYAEGKDILLPELNMSYIRGATKGEFSRLGKLMMNNGSVSRVAKMLKSIDGAYNQVNQLRGPAKRRALSEMPYATAEEAKNAVRQSYLQELFPQTGPEFDIKTYKKMAERFQSGEDFARLSTIMGAKDAKYVKQLMNIMKEASVRPESNIGELMLRAKEYGAIGALGLGAVQGSPGAVAFGASVLLGPTGLAKMATDPKRINRLLAFGERTFPTREAMNLAFLNTFADVISEITLGMDEGAGLFSMGQDSKDE